MSTNRICVRVACRKLMVDEAEVLTIAILADSTTFGLFLLPSSPMIVFISRLSTRMTQLSVCICVKHQGVGRKMEAMFDELMSLGSPTCLNWLKAVVCVSAGNLFCTASRIKSRKTKHYTVNHLIY